ncbi:MAG: TonB-dependent receptor [Gammaproteobacteria bacterium]|nr:TonB-dependent receptor [Gammaproteobacteria bacterium]
MPPPAIRRTLAAVVAVLLPHSALAQLEEIIVTAQKRAESAQDVPIAVTAFDAAALKSQQISTFGDMRFAAPNVSYAKGNFTSNNFAIRGIGTALVAAGSDDGVGIHVNEVPILFPRLFETEYYDVEQVAILRGPQGTLYGRNSTGGAVNMITKTAETGAPGGYAEGQYGNYDHTQIEGALNVPLGERFAVRIAGIGLQRDGYTENIHTGDDVDDRDQYSVRGSLRWAPDDETTVDLMASYFEEDSTRTRSQKQMCHNDPSGVMGCLPDRLAFETVNPLAQLTGLLPSRLAAFAPTPALSNDQSENPRDMRKVNMDFTPVYEADETLLTLRLEHEFERYSFVALAGYQDTSVLSQQDYNNNVGGTASPSPLLRSVFPITWATYFADGCLPISAPSASGNGIVGGHSDGCNNSLDGYDQSNQETDQSSFEVHVASNYDGALDFFAGAFYMEADTFNEYYVIASGLDYFSVVYPAVAGTFLGTPGLRDGLAYTAPSYINRVNSYELESSALFGELYYQLRDDVKLTLGLRYTVDEKDIDDVQYLYNSFVPFGFDGTITGAAGQPLGRVDNEKWEETTGRAVLDWSPQVSLTDATLLYASYSRGYKGGGFNPPFDRALFPDTAATYEPEYIDAFEIGAKNTLLDNTLQANITAFFYDYEGLQVSKIVNRTSFNENADAEIYGLESEFLFAPDEHWRFNANIAYLHTEVKDFASVDTRDPTAGRSDVTLIKDNLNASNCVINHNGAPAPGVAQLNSCSGLQSSLPAPYTVSDGVAVDLSGNQLINSPELTVSLGGQYEFRLTGDYSLLARLDYYWQDEMYGRIFNRDPIDAIDSWDVWNAQATLLAPDETWFVRAFVKNIMDDDNVVGIFVTDPSSGVFTNVFTIEPRTYGLAVGYNF